MTQKKMTKKKRSILVPLCTDAGTNTASLSLSLSVPPLLLNLSPLHPKQMHFADATCGDIVSNRGTTDCCLLKSSLDAKSAEDCRRLCLETADCLAWSYNQPWKIPGSVCFLRGFGQRIHTYTHTHTHTHTHTTLCALFPLFSSLLTYSNNLFLLRRGILQ